MTELTTRTFQWLKGDKAGQFVKWDGEILTDGDMNFLVFADGSRGNESLLGDYFVEVPNENEGFIDVEMMKPESSFQPLSPEHNPPLKRTVVPAPVEQFEPKNRAPENPISRLLLDSKKINTKIKLDLEVDIPPAIIESPLIDCEDPI